MKRKFNSDVNQFHQYQQNMVNDSTNKKKPTITSHPSNLTEHKQDHDNMT